MRKTQRPDFTRAVQWLSKHMTTLTQACLVLCLALISVAYIRIFNPTASESAFSPASRPLPIYNVDTQEKKIAISFDAAWGEEKTDEILQILKDRDIETTFFLVGYWVDKYPDRVRQIAEAEGSEVLVICAKAEEEIAQLDPEDKQMFLEDMGLEKSGLDRLVKLGYHLLGLISFLTAGPKEVRAWTITKGMTAPQAAGKIHSDFERGFIRAEVVSFDALVENGSMAACKEKGLVRSEGKDYVVKDGDIMLFRFNV